MAEIFCDYSLYEGGNQVNVIAMLLSGDKRLPNPRVCCAFVRFSVFSCRRASCGFPELSWKLAFVSATQAKKASEV